MQVAVIALLFTSAYAFPGITNMPSTNSSSDRDFVIVPMLRNPFLSSFGGIHGFGDIVSDDTEDESREADDGFGELKPFLNFNSFLNSFSDIYRRLRTNPFDSGPQTSNFNKLSNATSDTKIVNGHRITVNKTTYTANDNDGFGDGVLHVQMVVIHPVDEDSPEMPHGGRPMLLPRGEDDDVASTDMPTTRNADKSESNPTVNEIEKEENTSDVEDLNNDIEVFKDDYQWNQKTDKLIDGTTADLSRDTLVNYLKKMDLKRPADSDYNQRKYRNFNPFRPQDW